MLTAELTAPGGWLAAVIPGRLAVVHLPDPDAASLARLWAALCGEDGTRLVLDELTRNGLATTPGFVLVEWTGDADVVEGRFIVRGDAGVAIDTVRGSEDITARGVSTWVERPVSSVRGFRVECLPAETSEGPALPFIAGAAWVSSVSFGSAVAGFANVPGDIRAADWAAPSDDVDAGRPGAFAGAVPDAPAPVTQAPVARHPADDLDRTIADLEVTVAGEDADDPVRSSAEEDAPRLVTPSAYAPHETTAYDHLFGATMMRSVEDAAARPQTEEADGEASSPSVIPPAPPTAQHAAPPAAPAAHAARALGDHDGLTVLSGDLRALREAAASEQPPAPGSSSAALAGVDVPPAPAVDEEAGFTLRLPDGRSEPIDGMVVVGRAPSVSKMGGGRVPRLVTVDSIEHDISRNHVQLTVEGGTVVVTDLHSRNGTLIALPGKAPQKLRAGEPTSVIAGTVIDLGSGVTLGVVQA